MKPVFADTFYWIALLNPKDDWHQIALHYAHNNTNPIITTDGIIDEVLNYAASRGSVMRQKALLIYRQILREPTINKLFRI
jgi:predicted nucleic acid-binding protein